LQNFFSTPLATDIGLVQQREALKHICRQNRFVAVVVGVVFVVVVVVIVSLMLLLLLLVC
jgi:hypothetical protein